MSEKKELNLDNTDQAAGGWDWVWPSLKPLKIDDKAFSSSEIQTPSTVPNNIPNSLELHKIPELEKLKHFTNPPKNFKPSEQ